MYPSKKHINVASQMVSIKKDPVRAADRHTDRIQRDASEPGAHHDLSEASGLKFSRQSSHGRLEKRTWKRFILPKSCSA